MNNIKIGVKIIGVVLLLACISIAAVGLSAYRMLAIDTTYSALIHGPAKGTLMLARATRMVEATKADLYIMVLESEPAAIQKLAKEVDDDKAQFHDFLDKAKAGLPARAADIDKLAAEYDRIYPSIQEVGKDALANQDEQATTLVHSAVAGPMDAMIDSAVSLNNAANKEMNDDSDMATESVHSAIYLTVGMVGAGLAIILGLAFFVSIIGITKPIGAMTGAMGMLAAGNKTVEVPGQGREDEIGTMAAAVQVFKLNMIEADRLRGETEELKKQSELKVRQAMLDLATRFESGVGGVVDGVTAAATELQSTAQSMAATAEETSRQSGAVATASEETTQNVQTVAAATEELTASISEISNQVTESTRIVGEAVTQANDTNAKVQGLSEAAQKIGDVVRLINDIAGQTNLLALNATIEAARAGEAGKGFAVVASEVKILATQTAKATEEIGAQVRAIQDATTSSAEAIKNITQTINRVSEISTAIASAVEEQGAATQEISRNVQQAAQGTTEVSSNIASVTSAAHETGTAAGQVLTAAAELGKNGVLLKTQVEDFLRTVRAG
jgi:methyl-accepting chemotaxis protein